MEAINTTTLTLSQTMEEIAAANAEQASGVDELNRAIAQVDNSTQGNAGIVEELASNASCMHASVTEMSAAVSSFRTSAAQTAGGKPPRAGTPRPPAARQTAALPKAPAAAPKPKPAAPAVIDDDFEEF